MSLSRRSNRCSQGACAKRRLDELGTEPVAVATGCFQRDYPLATASGSVPGRLPTHILSYEAKLLSGKLLAVLLGHSVL